MCVLVVGCSQGFIVKHAQLHLCILFLSLFAWNLLTMLIYILCRILIAPFK